MDSYEQRLAGGGQGARPGFASHGGTRDFFFCFREKVSILRISNYNKKKRKKVRIRRRRQERDYRSASHWAGKDSVFLMALGWMGLAPPISGHVRTGQGGLDG